MEMKLNQAVEWIMNTFAVENINKDKVINKLTFHLLIWIRFFKLKMVLTKIM